MPVTRHDVTYMYFNNLKTFSCPTDSLGNDDGTYFVHGLLWFPTYDASLNSIPDLMVVAFTCPARGCVVAS